MNPQNPMLHNVLQHIMDTHKHALQQTGNINGGLLALLKQHQQAGQAMGQPTGVQAPPQAPQAPPAAPAAPQGAPMPGMQGAPMGAPMTGGF